MRLSKAQAKVLEYAKTTIDFARTHSPREWAEKQTGITPDYVQRAVEADKYHHGRERLIQMYEDRVQSYMKRFGKYYEANKRGVVLCGSATNSRTLRKLADLGLIAILHDSCGERIGIDEIQVLNY